MRFSNDIAGVIAIAGLLQFSDASLVQCTGRHSHSKASHLITVDGVANGTVVVPPCGETPCDNPETTLAYLLPDNRHLTLPKNIRYRVVNIANDDGSMPIVAQHQVLHQHQELNRAFAPYNITFELDHMIIKNTTLRQTGILFGCDPSMIGDGICQPECVLYSTGNDGGDCDAKDAVCSTDMISDGVCQQVCNNEKHNYDGGDCCVLSPDNEQLCLDPESPNRRRYSTIEDFKDFVRLPNDRQMNVMFAEWTNSYLIGLATFPWDAEHNAMGVRGGVVMKPKEYGMPGKTATLVHEVGHILGLWHVHHGVSEVSCGDFCYEWKASLTTGDLCSDTAPSPVHMLCSNPRPRSSCGRLQIFPHAPVSNFMSYSADDCMDHFSPQQTARMHCYINRFYADWRTDSSERARLQLYPVSTQGRVVLHWEETVAGRYGEDQADSRRDIPSDAPPKDDHVYLIHRTTVSHDQDRDEQQSGVRVKVRGSIFVDPAVSPGQRVKYSVTRLDSANSANPVQGKITVVVT